MTGHVIFASYKSCTEVVIRSFSYFTLAVKSTVLLVPRPSRLVDISGPDHRWSGALTINIPMVKFLKINECIVLIIVKTCTSTKMISIRT